MRIDRQSTADLLVLPEWLHQRLGDAGLRVVDGSWYLPSQNRDVKAEFLAGHIPGAAFFDFDAISDAATDLPHMLPDTAAFAAAAGALGLSRRNTIVVYDSAGLFSAPRVWWTLRVFGAADVRVLDGGLSAWIEAGYPLESGEAHREPGRFEARLNRDAVADFAAVGRMLDGRSGAVVDARSAARFRGEAPEPRPGLPSGHMPGACNVPFDRLVDRAGRLVQPAAVQAAFENAGVDLTRPVVTTCGSGVTAAVLALALATLGKQDVALYDGSWAEWASHPAAPIASGPA